MTDKKTKQYQMRVDDAFIQALIELRQEDAKAGVFRSQSAIIRDLVMKAATEVKKERKKR